jgi:hypothetical protein
MNNSTLFSRSPVQWLGPHRPPKPNRTIGCATSVSLTYLNGCQKQKPKWSTKGGCVRVVRLLITNSVSKLETPAGESLTALRSHPTLAAQEISTLDFDFHTRFVGATLEIQHSVRSGWLLANVSVLRNGQRCECQKQNLHEQRPPDRSVSNERRSRPGAAIPDILQQRIDIHQRDCALDRYKNTGHVKPKPRRHLYACHNKHHGSKEAPHKFIGIRSNRVEWNEIKQESIESLSYQVRENRNRQHEYPPKPCWYPGDQFVYEVLHVSRDCRPNVRVDRAQRLHSTFDSINQVAKYASRAPVQGAAALNTNLLDPIANVYTQTLDVFSFEHPAMHNHIP